MNYEAKAWLLLAVLSGLVASVEVWLVWEYQLSHGISDESTFGGPCLALGTVSLLFLVGSIMLRRKTLGLASLASTMLFLFLAYVFLIQW